MADSKNDDSVISGMDSLARANGYLAVRLHRLLAEDGKNVFFSPFSISTAMTMLMCGARGDTESELKAALGHEYAGLRNASTAFQNQISDIAKGSEHYTLSCANAMLTDKRFSVTEDYKSIINKYFDGNLLEVDFAGENKKAVKTINDWVKQKTNKMIPKLIDAISPATVLVLLNAIYFKGDWSYKFDKSDTRRQKFYNKGSKAHPKQTYMMHLKEAFPYGETDTYKVLELPYCGDKLAMLILLPIGLDGLEKLESNLTPTFVEDVKKIMRKTQIKVSLPRFRLEYSKSLVNCFKKMDVKRIFGGGDFGVISDGGLFVSEIFHKAVLEVNEEGSEAAAVTMIVMARCAALRGFEFTVDHPFLFVIYDKSNNLILFMGRVNEL